ncbi:MAG: cyclophilin-like family protein [Nitrososphaerota archaeon]
MIRYLAPLTVDALTRILPLEGRASLWKNMVYFGVPVKKGEEKAKAYVEKGALAYWPMGQAFCIFCEETRPYSPVNLVGHLTENLELFSRVKSGMKIRVIKG